MNKTSIAAAFLLVLISFTFSYAQDAESVIKKYLSVSGMDKVKEINTLSMSANINSSGMSMPMKSIVKKPNSFYGEMTISGQKMKMGYDGVKGWMVNPLMGNTPTEMPAEQVKQFNNQSALDQMSFLTAYKDQGFKATYLGKEKVVDKPAHMIKFSKKDTTDQIYFFDEASNLIVKQKSKVKVGDKEVETETLLKDYKVVDGLNMAHSIEVKNSEIEGLTTVTISDIKINKPVDESLFKMPGK